MSTGKTFRLGLSMAGTVSAGTYTAGCLVELYRWLEKWSEAKKQGIKLMPVKEVDGIPMNEPLFFSPGEVPDHRVVISALSGASGGGVSAGLFLSGLSLGKVESLLRDTWLHFDIRDMLDTDDLRTKNVYSLLNVKPIEKAMKALSSERWPDTNLTEKIDYLDDVVELYMTLASFEGIPYNLARYNGPDNSKFGVFKTHMDYIRFGFHPGGTVNQTDGVSPYRYELTGHKAMALKDGLNWGKLIEASPATGAFPIGFKPRAVSRFRKEYYGKLFYLDYAPWKANTQSASVQGSSYRDIRPTWPGGDDDQRLDMEYFDGGAFNREPHDLARASLLRKMGLTEMPPNGKDTTGAVLLIDPFPASADEHEPGQEVNGIPDLLGQLPLLLGSLMDQGRFRPDWVEKAYDEEYYSRFLISPKRPGNHKLQLAGEMLGAFAGFIDESYREHDYKLGHYNTFKFLSDHFMMRADNTQITYGSTTNAGLLKKYEAVGWYQPATDKTPAHCQVIPRCEEPNSLNSLTKPEWPKIGRDKWDEVTQLAEDRARKLADMSTSFKALDNAKDWAIWKLFAEPRFDKFIEETAKKLRSNGLLR